MVSPVAQARAMIVRCVAAAGVAVSMLAGCAHYEPLPLTPERSADDFGARKLTDASVLEGLRRILPDDAAAMPPRAWDRAQLLVAALVLNPQLSIADAKVRSSRAHEITTAQRPNPDLTLESEYAFHDQHPWLYGLSMGWLLRSPVKRRIEMDAARLETEGARLQMMNEIWSVRRDLATALSEWERARRESDLLERLGKAQDELVSIETLRVAQGEDPPSALLTAQTRRIDLEREQSAQRLSGAQAEADVAKTLGVPQRALADLITAWPDWGQPPAVDEGRLRDARELALLSRADLATAIGDYAVTERMLRLAVERQYPQLQLEPGYYWDHGIAKWPFDVGFTLPLNGNQGEIAEARAARDLAGRRMLALQADIFGEIDAALRAENLDRAAVDAARRRFDSARQRLNQAELGVRLGAADRQTEIEAGILAAHAELELLDMQAHLQSSRNGLEDALHAPLSGPELSLPRTLTQGALSAGS